MDERVAAAADERDATTTKKLLYEQHVLEWKTLEHFRNNWNILQYISNMR